MKTLTLKRETLAVLAETDLARVQGGAPSAVCTSALTFCDKVCELVHDFTVEACTGHTV